MLHRPSKAVMAPIAEAVGTLAGTLTQPFISRDVGYVQDDPGQKSRKVRNHMLKSPFKSVIARAATFALVLSLGIAFVSVGLNPSAHAQTMDDPPCSANDDGVIECDYDENGMDSVADFSAMDPEGDSIDWSLGGTDDDLFDITGGVLTFKMSPDFEDAKDAPHTVIDLDGEAGADFDGDAANDATNNVYVITVKATEDLPEGEEGPANDDEILVRVTVTNEDEPGEISILQRQPQVGVELEGMASDPDNQNAAGTAVPVDFEYEWSVAKVVRPVTNNNKHWVAASGTADDADYTPTAAEEGSVLRLKVSYTDTSDAADAEDKEMYVLTEFAVRAVPVDENDAAANDAPIFVSGGDYTRTIDENSPMGTSLGAPVTANPVDGDVLYYTIATPGTAAIPFEIDKITGQITVAGTVHFEPVGGIGGTYTIAVTATDPFRGTPPAGTATENVVVTVRDVNEKPTVEVSGTPALSTPEIDSDLPAADYTSDLSASYTKADVDADDETTFKLAGEDADLFELTDENNNQTYELAFKDPPDFDKPGDANKNNEYKIMVVATDKAGLDSDPVNVSVMVTDVPETGTVTLSNDQPAVGVLVTATLMEPDTKVTGESWQWQRSLDGTTNFQDIEDATSATYTPAVPVPDDTSTEDINESDPGDEGYFLRAIVMYRDNASVADDPADDTDDTPETAMGDSMNAVRVAPGVNGPPAFDSASMTRTVDENTEAGKAAGDPVTATDPDEGDDVMYSITGGADMDAFDIDEESGQIEVGTGTMLDYEMGQRTYVVEVTADDAFGGSDSTMVTIMVTDVNEDPDVTLMSTSDTETPACSENDDGVVECDYDENGMDSVADFSAMDPEGDSIDWSLGGTDDDLFDITGGVLTFKMSPDFEDAKDEDHTVIDLDGETGDDFDGDAADDAMNNVYVITVKATEDLPEGEEGPANDDEILVRVTVTNEDEPGEISILQRQPQVGVELEGMASDPDDQDADGEDVTVDFGYEWSVAKVSRPVIDNNLHWVAATGTPDNENYTPTAAEIGSVLRLKVSYTDASDASDAEDKEMYVLTEFAVRAVPVDENNAAANDAPVFVAGGDYTRTIDENSPMGTLLGAPVTANPVDGDVLYYTIATPGTAAIPFEIDKITGQITVAGTVHFEPVGGIGGTYTIAVTATDPFRGTPPAGTATENVVVTVRDVNEKPTVEVSGTPALSTPEIDSDLPAADYTSDLSASYTKADVDADDETTFKLAGEDADLFELTDENNNQTYELAFKDPPDFDKPGDANKNNEYKIMVVATDKAGLDSDPVNVSVMVTDVPETGTVTLSNDQPAVGISITATLMEPDTKVTGESWQWQRSLDGTTNFQDIEDATSATYTPAVPVPDDTSTEDINESDPGDEGYFLRAIVMYRDNASVADDPTDDADDTPETAMGDSVNAVRVAPGVNGPPAFDSASMTRTVDENTGAGKAAGDPVTATDPDEGDEVMYSITGGADMDAFDIDEESGQIEVGTGTMLDYEMGQRTYVVEVTATDPFGLAGSTTVTIMVEDVNESPMVTLIGSMTTPPVMPTITVTEDATADYEENGTGAVGTYTSSEADATWSLSGEDMDDFSISSDGVLSFMSPPDFEAPTDANTDNVYMVTVVANAPGANEGSLAVVVNVTDMDEGTNGNGNGNGAFDPLSYDANENGVIDRPEVITAIRHYFDDVITRDDVLAVIKAYFNGS